MLQEAKEAYLTVFFQDTNLWAINAKWFYHSPKESASA